MHYYIIRNILIAFSSKNQNHFIDIQRKFSMLGFAAHKRWSRFLVEN